MNLKTDKEEKYIFHFFNQLYNFSDLVITDEEFVLIKGYTLTS